MRFSVIAASLFAAVALAAPLEERQVTLCTGTDSNAQCCATDVLGLADLNCADRTSSTSSS